MKEKLSHHLFSTYVFQTTFCLASVFSRQSRELNQLCECPVQAWGVEEDIDEEDEETVLFDEERNRADLRVVGKCHQDFCAVQGWNWQNIEETEASIHKREDVEEDEEQVFGWEGCGEHMEERGCGEEHDEVGCGTGETDEHRTELAIT